MQPVAQYDVAIPKAHETRLLKRGRMRRSVEITISLFAHDLNSERIWSTTYLGY